MALCGERIYDDAMPYFCHTTHRHHRKQKRKKKVLSMTWLGATQMWSEPCHFVDTLALERDWIMCLDACLALLLLSHIILITIFPWVQLLWCNTIHKEPFQPTAALTNQIAERVAQGCHVTGLFCCLALNVLSGLNIGKYSINNCLCAEY